MGKILGYLLIIAIFIAAAFYLAIGKFPQKISFSKKPVATITLTPTPANSNTTKITIYAAGTASNKEFPTMELRIDGATVQTWKGVKGDPKNGKFDEFTYVYPGIISSQLLQVAFINDAYVSPEEDRNLYVDRVIVGEASYISDSPATLTTVLDKSNKRCSDGNTYSRWLLCNGYFTFKNYDLAFVPPPTPEAKPLTGSLIKIFAAGKYIGNDAPMFDLKIKNRIMASFRVAGDPTSRTLGEYDYLHYEKVIPSDIIIAYTNDWYQDSNNDRNLFIDRINLDGTDYFADSTSVYQTGVWQNGKCSEGYLRSKQLWCPNATIHFGAR